MTVRRGRELIQLPGPTNIPERVLRAMNRQVVDFATPAFTAMARGCLDDLRRVFQTKGEIYGYASIGHGMWEVALANLVSPGESVLLPESGMFSFRWQEMAERLGVSVETIPGDWRHAVDPAAIEAHLRADREHRIRAVAVVQVETSTGIRNDIQAIRRAIDAAGHPALLIVDAIASLAVLDLPMDEWGCDVVLAASQKGLMMPPGMGFVAVGPKAERVAAEASTPRAYWDWRSRRGAYTYMWFHGTPPVHMLFALRESLDMLLEESLPAVFARHRRLARAVRAAVSRWAVAGGLEFQALDPAERSDAVTALRFADGLDPDRLRLHCHDRLSVAFGGGLGPLGGKVLRIGHMGDLNEPMILGALAVLETGLRELAFPHAPGGVTAAIEALAQGE
jgi:alanine-glyoxylate transaminase/serine-glyoxylate transaminase/serine-pyruvate transaminase